MFLGGYNEWTWVQSKKKGREREVQHATATDRQTHTQCAHGCVHVFMSVEGREGGQVSEEKEGECMTMGSQHGRTGKR